MKLQVTGCSLLLNFVFHLWLVASARWRGPELPSSLEPWRFLSTCFTAYTRLVFVVQFLFFFKQTNKQNNIIEPENVNVTSSLFIFESSGLLCGFVALTQFLLCVFLTVNTDCCRDFAGNFMLLLGCFYPFSGLNSALLLCSLHDAHSQRKQTPHLMDSLSYYCRTQGTQVFKSSFQLCAHL